MPHEGCLILKKWGDVSVDIDKSQHESFQKQGDTAFVSQGVLGKESRLFFFKNKMVLSTKDYIIIFCLAVLALIAVAATAYMQPLDFFHVISNEQLQAIIQQKPQGTFLENLKKLSQGQFLSGVDMIEMWRAAGWNGVWAFLCLLPEVILGCFIVFFPSILFLHITLKRDLKQLIQQLEKSPE